jgi:hypothetical protein
MNLVAKQLMVKVALPMLTKIVREMIKSVDLAVLRDQMLTYLLSLAQKTETGFDDKMVEALMPLMFADEYVAEFLGMVLPTIRSYVASSATHWDDEIILPILDIIEDVFNPT